MKNRIIFLCLFMIIFSKHTLAENHLLHGYEEIEAQKELIDQDIQNLQNQEKIKEQATTLKSSEKDFEHKAAAK